MPSDRFNDRRLREESLKLFVKALHTDRMVAVTGAMSTRALGYPSWDEFVQAYAIVARELATTIRDERRGDLASDLAKPIRDELRSGWDRSPAASVIEEIIVRAKALESGVYKSEGLDPRVPLWALHESFRAVDMHMRQVRCGLVINEKYQKPVLPRFEKALAGIFRSRTLGDGPLDGHASAAAVGPLIASLGIKRIATLNYDLELERAFMLRGDEREIMRKAELEAAAERSGMTAPGASKAAYFAAKGLKSPSGLTSVANFIGKRESGKPIVVVHRNRLSRTMTNGIHVESDIVDRERPDRLFEFAIGSAETDRHILHLHGRADVPRSMVANIRQYDRLYRLDDLYRDPFDHSLRILFGGNPIMFVGVGMTEAELNATLQYFVSNVPVRRPAPTFVIWNTVDQMGFGSEEAERKERYMRDRRLDFRTRLGVHLLFDEDITQRDDGWLERLKSPFSDRDISESTFLELLKLIDPELTSESKWLSPARSYIRKKLQPDRRRARRDARNLEAMATMLTKLPALVSRVDRRVERKDEWRTATPRFKLPGPHRILGATQVCKLVADNKEPRIDAGKLALDHADRVAPRSRLLFAASEPGYGRGELAEHLLQLDKPSVTIEDVTIDLPPLNNRLLVHAGFSYDSDAMLSSIAEFLADRVEPPITGLKCREKLFADRVLFDVQALVIVNGVDRFFGSDGAPLSAELDHMLRCAKHGKVTFLLLGTDRLSHYCAALQEKLYTLSSAAFLTGAADAPEPGEPDPCEDIPIGHWARATQLEMLGDNGRLGSRYLDFVAARYRTMTLKTRGGLFAERAKGDPRLEADLAKADISDAGAALIGRALSVDRNALNRAFFDAYLSPTLLYALHVHCPEAFEILRTMCFIGAPIEAVVLLHAPKVYAILAEDSKVAAPGTNRRTRGGIERRFEEVVELLRELGLLIEIDSYDPRKPSGRARPAAGSPLWRRYSLHRALATFLRDRHGAPINDAKLATAFNMSLFMSEPSENYAPEPDFHDELGDLVDSLIGGWHDLDRLYGPSSQKLPGAPQPEDYREDLSDLYVHPADDSHAWETLKKRSSREAAACLRAALSLVRGYYSTGALLKLDRDDRLAAAERDGALTEHARRLDRLVTGFGDISIARRIVRKIYANARQPNEGIRHLGPDPFYADDLVWLHNERGVVALAQGHMFDAREAFSAADAVNKREVEIDYHGHNWRRIALNLVATQIERGLLKPAERRLEQIDATINDPRWCGGGTREHGTNSRVEAIRALFADPKVEPPMRGSAEFLREEMLIVGMTTSYRGLIAHIRGRYHDARDGLSAGINILRRLGEQRALAHFQRHLASLHSFIGNKAQASVEIDYAINAAQSAKQMDILHRSRVVRANLWRKTSNDPTLLRHALQDIKDALRYAALSDCYRVRIEASASLARHMRHGGDYDTALRYATDALTVASRYGHSLQKTLLRIEIGQILIARGDPLSGEALLTQAIAIGTTKGYHQALEHVRRARNALAANPPMPNRTDIAITH